jgi:hypothetical protein
MSFGHLGEDRDRVWDCGHQLLHEGQNRNFKCIRLAKGRICGLFQL